MGEGDKGGIGGDYTASAGIMQYNNQTESNLTDIYALVYLRESMSLLNELP